MSINNRDDYDKLAKILYPSIEASGNVYFGQTRKLTMDEILGKNNLNFESHIESFNKGDSTYTSYFMWKLGPLHGSVKLNCDAIATDDSLVSINVFPDVNEFVYIGDEATKESGPGYYRSIFFARYNILLNTTIDETLLNSGAFNVYSCNAIAEFNGICYTSGMSPSNPEDADDPDRNFYIDYANKILYIKIVRFNFKIPEIKYTQQELNTPLTFIANNADTSFQIIAYLGDSYDSSSYAYSIDGINWTDITVSTINDTDPNHIVKTFNPVDLHVGDYVKVKCTNYVPLNNEASTMEQDVKHIQFTFGDETIVIGNINSLLGENFSEIDSIENYCFYKLFYNNSLLISPQGWGPILPAHTLGAHCYEQMFSSTGINTPPDLPATVLSNACYTNMFYNCVNLTKTPILPAQNLVKDCYMYMFNSCTSLNEIHCYAKTFANYSTDDWIEDTDYVYRTGLVYVDPTTNWEDVGSEDSSLPANWTKVNNHYIFNVKLSIPTEDNKNCEVTISGSDTSINGRGKLEPTTLFNMLETNPLYNGGVSFDIYNKDGSFNQEIWGLKSFNSPVMFRNGIYGECASLTTWPWSEYNDLSSRKYYINGNDDLYSYNELFGSMITCPNKEMHTEYNSINMYQPDGFVEIKPRSAIYSAHANFKNIYDASDAGVLVTQSAIASSHIDNNQSGLYQLMLNENIQNVLPDRTAIVCANTSTFVGQSLGVYKDSVTTNSAIMGCKSYDKSAYVLTESKESDGGAGSTSSKVEISADEVLISANETTVQGNFNFKIPVFKKEWVDPENPGVPNKFVFDLSKCIGLTTMLALEFNSNSQHLIAPGDYFTFELTRAALIADINTHPTFLHQSFFSSSLNGKLNNVYYALFNTDYSNNSHGYIYYSTNTSIPILMSEEVVRVNILSVSDTTSSSANIVYALVVITKDA